MASLGAKSAQSAKPRDGWEMTSKRKMDAARQVECVTIIAQDAWTSKRVVCKSDEGGKREENKKNKKREWSLAK